jgi:peptidoglycan/xylan/chitin deacetylase (PgdA/CDA1 family)
VATDQLTSSRFRIPGIPVFLYHGVCSASTSDDRYAVPVAKFREHLSLLREEDFVVESLQAMAGTSGVRRAVITFDDGLCSDYERAFPALLDHGFTATFFVTTTLVDTPGYVSWSQLREMSAAGMTIGSHGREHVDYSALSPAITRRELQHSRTAIEDALGKPALTFSAPYGFLNQSLVESARSAGFKLICTSQPWLAAQGSTIVSRLAVYRDTDLHSFSALANGRPLPLIVRRVRNAFLYVPKQLLLHTSPQRLGVRVHQEIE